MDPSLRRSSRLGHAGDRVTAATGIGPTSSSAVQSTSSKKTTFANMKTSNKTSSRASSSSMKRKSQSEKVGSKPKKNPRMAEEFTQEESPALTGEISQILQPLLDQLDGVINSFPQYQNEAWHLSLVTRRALIPLLNTQVKSRDELRTRPELGAFSRKGKPLSLAEAERDE